MEAWAAGKYKDRAHFLCLSCAGPKLAQQMGARSKMRAAVNGWLDEGAMPVWGQLGCNGFIVLDAQQRIVSPATAAYMQHREAAWGSLEDVLDAELGLQGSTQHTAQHTAEHTDQGFMGAVSSVGDDVMDGQHMECVAALNTLREQRSKHSLEQLLIVLEEHFSSEEEHMTSLSRGIEEGTFDVQAGALASHAQEHRRMLALARSGLESEECSAGFVSRLISEFQEHVVTYDSNY
eukprot:TRINITY_DN20285_c0_g1_i1.p1 TRINITY_DN20285_c0_g1~~TRINITY_DN20285_c0_g1_i1.p1  ORF type:complete len:235 (-),score=67.00 TRINITY_DN20285_c0_g1_i1:243-947(-)